MNNEIGKTMKRVMALRLAAFRIPITAYRLRITVYCLLLTGYCLLLTVAPAAAQEEEDLLATAVLLPGTIGWIMVVLALVLMLLAARWIRGR